ncbi:MAG: DUF3489 domain-containing protein [Alphaproteobacteria bacterium]
MDIQTQKPEIKAPRTGSKQAKLVVMLSRKNGVTLAKASETLGWLPHTTSATMTGLRGRGYEITRIKREGKDTLYVIHPDEAE